ncbi:galactose-1-phosphate uridylyltransferase [Candidatus Woesearchaeota archaeon]|nr:galactose-1-phosphate uridylyltransferase [Candidatus Woesearchaeota archaeon]
MGELRKDYILDRWVIIAPARGKRPHQLQSKEESRDKTCHFCPGNEDGTPAEIGRVEKDGRWALRWFPNKYPALAPEGQAEIRTDNRYYTFSASYGYHELIAESPDHHKQLWDLDPQDLVPLLNLYCRRIEELMLLPSIQFVAVIKNHGLLAGTSIVHTHSQVFALNHIPAHVRENIEAFRKHSHCPYCDVISREKDSYRHCFENAAWIAFTPYASRYNYEIWILPKAHAKNLSHATDLNGLADILHQILGRLKVLDCSYNYAILYSPIDDFHFRIEVTPRIATPGGFEMATDEFINTVSPEDAAAFYRGERGVE